MANHKKYRCADYAAFDTLKEARQHASELSKGVERDNLHITSLIYQCVDCRAFYGVYLPYETKLFGKTEKLYMALVRTKTPKQTAEIIPFPRALVTRTNPGLIEIRRAA